MGEWHSLGLSFMAMDCINLATDKLDYIAWNRPIKIIRYQKHLTHELWGIKLGTIMYADICDLLTDGFSYMSVLTTESVLHDITLVI